MKKRSKHNRVLLILTHASNDNKNIISIDNGSYLISCMVVAISSTRTNK